MSGLIQGRQTYSEGDESINKWTHLQESSSINRSIHNATPLQKNSSTKGSIYTGTQELIYEGLHLQTGRHSHKGSHQQRESVIEQVLRKTSKSMESTCTDYDKLLLCRGCTTANHLFSRHVHRDSTHPTCLACLLFPSPFEMRPPYLLWLFMFSGGVEAFVPVAFSHLLTYH